LVEGLADEVRQDLRVGLRVEGVPTLEELFAEELVIFNNAIVDEMEAAGLVRVGVGVFTSYRAMGGPPGVADAGMAGDGKIGDLRGEVGDTAHGLAHVDAAGVEKSDPGGVVAAVFQAPEAVKQHRKGIGAAYVSNNSTHKTNVTIERQPRKLCGKK
jgi:hypothetical protein